MGKKSRRSRGSGGDGGGSGPVDMLAGRRGDKSEVKNAPPSHPSYTRPSRPMDPEEMMSGIFASMLGAGGQDGCAETNWKNLPAQELFLAAMDHDVERIRDLLTDGEMRGRVNDMDGDGVGIVHNLAFNKSSDDAVAVIKLLADAGHDVDMESRQTKETALQIATIYGHPKTVQALVDCGARVDKVDWKGKGPIGTAREKCTHSGAGGENCCEVLRIIEEAEQKMKSDTSRVDKAEDLRAKGNKAYQSGDFHLARSFYTQSLDILEDPRAFSNRALCNLKIGREIFETHGVFEKLPGGSYRTVYPDAVRQWGTEAKTDAGKAIEMHPTSEKAHHRQVLGYAMMRDFPRAKMFCKEGLEKCPESDSLKKAMRVFEELNTSDGISNSFSNASLEADRRVAAGCEVFQCSYCFKKQEYVTDPTCVQCSMDMSKYKPGKMAPLIINFIMQW